MITPEYDGEYIDTSLDQYNTYEEYLNKFIEDKDRKYLEDIDLARQLVELGIHSKTQTLKKEQFYAKKRAIAEARRNQNKDKVRILRHQLVDPPVYLNDEFLKTLAEKEDDVLNGRLMVIIFIRAIIKKPSIRRMKRKKKNYKSRTDYDKFDIRTIKYQKMKEEKEERERLVREKEGLEDEEDSDNDIDFEEEFNRNNGIEISGYIDFAHRLKTEDFTPYFKGEKILLPKTNDLSYYNWNTGTCVSNDSPNFKVDASSGKQGLLFRNKRDRKVINVNPESKSNDSNTERITVTSLRKEYKQIVIFDHKTRRKT